MRLARFFADFERLESLLGLPHDFVLHLLQEDDWSFVIKGHAVVEAAITHLLVGRLDSTMAPFAERLPLGGRQGKLELVTAFKLLPDDCVRFIRRLAELRNTLIHGKSAFRFELTTYVQGLPPGERATLVKHLAAAVGVGADPDLLGSGGTFLSREPKMAFAWAIFGVLAQALFAIAPEEHERALSKANESAGAVALVILLTLAAATAGGRNVLGEGQLGGDLTRR